MRPIPSPSWPGGFGLTARLIKAGLGTRVYYLEQGGYDTHGQQLPRHAALLEELCGVAQGVPRRPGGVAAGRPRAGAGLQRVRPPRCGERFEGDRPRHGRAGAPGRPVRPAGPARGLPEPHRPGLTAT